MIRPCIPVNEARRLEALRAYRILDTPREVQFDALTELTAEILEVPIALISLVDEDRQWFKSRHGLDANSTSRSVSFCGHVVASTTPLIVHDALQDERFADNPLVVNEPGVRFYAGMPLCTTDGFVVGTLCAIDRVPRSITPRQLGLLSQLAKLVVKKLEARLARLVVEDRTLALGLRAASVGHEINNALALVTCSVEDAIESLSEPAPPNLASIAQVLRGVKEGALRIGRIVDGLRDLGSRTTQFAVSDVASVVDVSIRTTAREVQHRARVNVSIEGAQQVLTDESKVTQVLVNLILNAAQAFVADDPARNRIDIACSARDDGWFEVTVRDNASGIPAHLLPRIFDPFVTSKSTGTGLGLMISRGIARELGGDITVESEEGVGSVFRVVLPAYGREALRRQSSLAPR